MNKSFWIVLLALLLMGSVNAVAAPNVVIGSDSIAPGQAASISLTFQADGVVTALDFKFTFDNTQFTATPMCVGSIDTTAVADAAVACSVVGNEVRVFVSAAAAFPVPAITSGARNLGTVSFQSLGSTPATTYPLNVTEENYADTLGDPVTPTASTNGSITVLGPVYSSNPPPGALNVGSVQANGTDPSVNVVISNSTGGTGTTLSGTCSETEDLDGVFSISGDTNFSVPQAGPTDTVTVTCDSAGGVGNHTGKMECTHNGTNTSPQVYDLSCNITPGPQPSFSSNPAPGVITLGPVPEGTNPAPTQNISISNSGDASTTLTGTCAMGAGDSEITLTSDGSFGVVQGGVADIQTVSCSTANEGSFSRTLTCPHNGSNGPNAVFTVNCTIDPPPAPEYSSNPAIGETLDFGGVATEEGDPDPTDTVTITNTGDTGSELDVTCTDSSDPSGVFSVTNGTITNLLPTGGNRVVTVTCSAATQGNYTGTLSCSHNGETATNPATYPLSCLIGPPGAAIFDSDPDPDSTIDLTPQAVAEGTDVTPLPLVFRNATEDEDDSDLRIQCQLSGDPEISSVGADLTSLVSIAPGDSETAEFDCDTTTAGSYSATYSCGYDTAPVQAVEAPQGEFEFSAEYTIECEVREPIALVEPQPPHGTAQQALVEPGGSHIFSVQFNEIADEGVNAQLEECTLASGANFTILSPTFPAVISAGGSVTVQVEGTDPGGVDEFSDTLNCIYSDSNHPYNGDNELGQAVEYLLTIIVGGDATFTVTKEFTDGDNPTEVDVTISCFTGLPLVQSQTISETRDVKFVVTSFDSGELDCEITEDLTELVGYTPTYYPTSEGAFDSDGGCNFYDVAGGDDNYCHIVNDADPVEIVIDKVWVIDGSEGDQVDQHYKLFLYCDTTDEMKQNQLGYGYGGCHGGGGEAPVNYNGPSYGFCEKFEGNGDGHFVALVEPDYPETNCWVVERVYDDSVEIDNGCENLVISAGHGASCVVTNTVFFEGIPTLSQYGLAIMALLMLGVGLVGFRRFA